MKKLAIALLLVVMGTMVACSGGGGNNGGPGPQPISVSITPNGSTSVGVTLTQQFTASVTGTSNTAVDWTVAGSGCSGAACGTISTSGLYTAPASIPNPHSVTVTATSVADTSKSANVTVNIVGITVAVAPSSATVALTLTQQFSAQVNPPSSVTWSVSGSGCSGNACGTVNSSGLYTAPSSLPTPATVTVTATSTAQPTSSGKATITLVASQNSRLSGQFAFRFSGFDSTGPVYIAGTFTADGASPTGNITNGVEDINRSSGVTTQVPFTGTYTIGNDSRGQMTITANSVTSTYDLAIGSGTEVIFTELDTTGVRGGGIMDKASPSSFSNSQIAGPYVMSLFGTDNAGKRVGAAARFVTDGAGNITSGSYDVNDAGSPQSNLSLTGTYMVNTTNGRTTLNLTIQNLGTVNYTFYIVTQKELFMVSTDPASANTPRVVGIGSAQSQNNTYTNAILNGTGIFNLTGLQSAGSVVAIGEITGNGTAGTLTGMFDENDAGSISPAGQALSGTYAVSSTGRGTMSLTGTNPPASSLVIYAFAQGAAYLLDMSSANALSGSMQQQSPGASGFFTPSSLQGSWFYGTITPSDSNANAFSGVLNIDGISSFSGTEDESTPTMNSPMLTVTGTYTVASDGRGTASLTAPSAEQQVFYIVDTSKFLSINVDAGNNDAALISTAR